MLKDAWKYIFHAMNSVSPCRHLCSLLPLTKRLHFLWRGFIMCLLLAKKNRRVGTQDWVAGDEWYHYVASSCEVEKIQEDNLDSIPSPSPLDSVKIQMISGKVCLRWELSTNFWKHKVCWHHPLMFYLKPQIIWEGESGGIALTVKYLLQSCKFYHVLSRSTFKFFRLPMKGIFVLWPFDKKLIS